jgi:Ca-activated chloride channel family protein
MTRKTRARWAPGHAVTALYEVVPIGASPVALAADSLTYQQISLRPSARRSSELMTVRLRYKAPQGTRGRLLSTTVQERRGAHASMDMRFASAVVAFALVLRGSEYKGDASYAMEAQGEDTEGYREEFISMVDRAWTLSAGGETVLQEGQEEEGER